MLRKVAAVVRYQIKSYVNQDFIAVIGVLF